MLAYCDRIVKDIQKALKGGWLDQVGAVIYDLHETEGYMISTKKTLYVSDKNGKRYRITVEEA